MFKKALNKLMKEKSTYVESFPLWIRKCMNQKLVHASSLSMLTLNLLHLWPPVTELCGRSDLSPPLSLCCLWCELVPLRSWVLAAAHNCTMWQKGLLLGLGLWCSAPDLRVWGSSCEHTGDFSMQVLGTLGFSWNGSELYKLCHV